MVSWIALAGALALGVVLGWSARAALERAVMSLILRVMASEIGDEKLRDGFAKVAAKERARREGERG